jgi:outer membrane protein assembly factor BamB
LSLGRRISDQCRSRGNVAVCNERGVFVVDNVVNGYELYQLERGEFARCYFTNVERRVRRRVAFGEDSRVVVGGSDRGIVYVFDRQTGEMLDTLPHAKKGLVQTIAVRQNLIEKHLLTQFTDSG